MDVLLIAPPEYRYVKAFSAREYLGLEYLASSLRKNGYTVGLLNCNLATTTKEAAKTAVDTSPAVVGISIPTLPNLPGAFQLVTDMQAAGFNNHITLGGHVPTFGCTDILNVLPAVDTIVRGEGELTFCELVQTLESGGSLHTVKGIAFKEKNKVVITPPRPLIKDIDVLPFPSRDILKEITEKAPTLARAAVATGRGCYGNCSFCSVHAFYKLGKGPQARLRSPTHIVDELQEIVNEFGISSIFFIDDNFIGPGKKGKRRAAEIAQEIIKRGLSIKFTLYCRANDVEKELFTLLKRAGLTRVFVGIESGVQSVLDRFLKGTTVAGNVSAITILKKMGITWDAGFILYDPDTTFEEFKENVEFIRKTRLYRYPAATLLLNGLTVYPGTPIEHTLREEGRLNPVQKTSLIIGNARTGVASPTEQVLQLLDADYTIADPRVEAIRQIVDAVEAVLSPQYDVVWPLLTEWDHWIQNVVDITGMHPSALAHIPELNLYTGDQLLRWSNNLGALIVNILETLVDFFENDGQLHTILPHIHSMIAHYNTAHFYMSFEEKMAEIQKLLSTPSFKFTVNGVPSLLSMAEGTFTVTT